MPVVTKVRDPHSSSSAFSSETGLLHRSFWASPRHPYYIFCPDYRENSAGVLALHFLCHSLNLIGYEAYVTAQSVNPRLRTPQLTPTIERVHMAARNMPVTI